MSEVSSSRRGKRKRKNKVSELEPQCFKAATLGSSLLLGIPADTDTSLPVWEAMRSQELDISWTIDPYRICIVLTSVTSKPTQSKLPTCNKSLGQPSTLPPSFLRPHAQQQGATQNTFFLLASHPINNQSLQSFPNESQNVSLTPVLATSLNISLPVLITQQQASLLSGTSTKEVVLPVTRTTATQTTTPTPAEFTAPSQFHTRRSSEVLICDDFLLRHCNAGKRCKMHHTPYPFHWQMWCVTAHEWIDFPLHCQVFLERLYCNVNNDTVHIKDGEASYTLTFESMELNESSRFDAVRRLTNSDSLTLNHHFPSKWKIYWWDQIDWKEYDMVLSIVLLDKMSKKEPECSFFIGSQEYKVDFTIMNQINVTTGFSREVRCRPVYRSPDSMQPYLQTGIQMNPTKPGCSPEAAKFSVDPLVDFSSWYPPVWDLAPGMDYSLVDLPVGTVAYRTVRKLFHESLSETMVDVICIQQVQNLLQWDKYQRHKVHMQKQRTERKEPLERHLFHGTTKEASEDICHNNFDPRMFGLNGRAYGCGSYFATTASVSNSYAVKAGPDEVCHMFLAKVLVGNVSLGKPDYRRPPPLKSKEGQFIRYDACVNQTTEPSVFVVFDSCQCYPYYLIKYKVLPKEIEL